MAKPLRFRDMINSEPAPGEDELINYRKSKKKRTYSGNEDVESETEALSIQQRMKVGRRMKRLKQKIKIGREKAKRRMANMDTLKKRARKSARKLILKKLTKGKDKNDLPFARRQELEKRLDKPAVKKRIDMLAKRMVKDKRKQEIDRKKK
tara:strand:- start:242 stop:694 length:453 start_codon:yes stop_codon:yes gene_type:complete